MTQLSRTAVIPQLANSESPRIWQRSASPVQALAARPIYRAALAGEVGSPRAAPLSGQGNTPRHLWMLAGRKVPVTPTLSGRRSEEYIEALISQ
jgi:hypothetical protein